MKKSINISLFPLKPNSMIGFLKKVCFDIIIKFNIKKIQS